MLLIVVAQRDLEDVLHFVSCVQSISGEIPLGLVHGYGQLAVFAQFDVVFRTISGSLCVALILQRKHCPLFIFVIHIHAAAEIDHTLIRRTVRILDVEIGISRPAEFHVVAGIALQLGPVPFAGFQGGAGEGAHIGEAVLFRRAVHIADNAALLIDRRRAGLI